MSFGPPASLYTQSRREAADKDRRRRALCLITVGGLCLTLLAACLGGWLWLSSPAASDPVGLHGDLRPRQLPGDVREEVATRPRNQGGTELLSLLEGPLKKNEMVDYPGLWLTDTRLVEARGTVLEGWKLTRKRGPAKEKGLYKLDFGASICSATQHLTVDGRTAVLVMTRDRNGDPVCGRIIGVDLNKGKKLWDEKLPGALSAGGGRYGNPSSVTISQDTAVAAWGIGSASYDLRSGKRLWADTQPSECTDQGFAGGRRMLAVVGCGEIDRMKLKVEEIDPRTGKPKWTYAPGEGLKQVHVVSTAPVVLSVLKEAGEYESLLIHLDDAGKVRSTMPGDQEWNAITCGKQVPDYFAVDQCSSVVVSETHLFIASKKRIELGDAPSNEVIAYDLATGKSGKKFDGRDLAPIQVVQANGSKALAYQTGMVSEPGVLFELDPVTGKKTPFYYIQTEDWDFFEPDGTHLVYHRGRLAIGATQTDDEDDPSVWVIEPQ
ncbi:PQQ-binding-like beta-propeller repeat protein [Streptomyces sp. NA04227]|uniref:outer membrane protein assembly factor BamB family protein n=1 Tax=Streptomyces sp. NA04227 TaxID=2742136 RepID=UPI0015912488|nr:PQQ-binding-like beta-propeller repeat protein [Streptomyces sp. NA04227]QKW09516.1 PQQ-binding-like beta-propeller repeat protein [Streptomyces sp. NA04227]